MRASCSFVALASLLLALAVLPAAQATNYNTWAHYTYDNDVTTDSSGAGHPALVGGTGPVSSRLAYHFGPSGVNLHPLYCGFVQIPYVRAPSWSFSFYLFRNATFLYEQPVFNPAQGQVGEFNFFLTPQNQLTMQFGNGPTYTFCNTLNLLQWKAFAVTATAVTTSTVQLTLYVNGQECSTYEQSTPTPLSSTQYYWVLQWGDLYLDELWMFNSALASTAVADLYQNNQLPV